MKICDDHNGQINLRAKQKYEVLSTTQCRPGSDGNEEVLRIPHSSSITGVSPSDLLVSYPRHLLGESYPYAEMQSVYSTVPADWAIYKEGSLLHSNSM